MTQPSLFETIMSDLVREVREDCAADAKAAALAQVAANADADWSAAALAAVRKACAKLEFTTDDVWALVPQGYATHEPRAMGAIMNEAARLGWCRKTDRVVPSGRVQCHKRPVAVWVSREGM